MGEVVHCVSCRRPISPQFVTCPFCKADQPPRPTKVAPIKCATCKRPYNPALETCPFCARQQAGYREVSPTHDERHDEYRQARAEFEASESRLGAALGWSLVAIVLGAVSAIALSSKVHAFGSSHLGWTGALAMLGGVVSALVGPRVLAVEGPRLGFFLAGWFAAAPLGYLLVVLLMFATASPPVRVQCAVTSHSYAKRSYGTPSVVWFTCTLSDGSTVSGSAGYGDLHFAVGDRFSMEVRRAPGGLLFEPTSVRAR